MSVTSKVYFKLVSWSLALVLQQKKLLVALYKELMMRFHPRERKWAKSFIKTFYKSNVYCKCISQLMGAEVKYSFPTQSSNQNISAFLTYSHQWIVWTRTLCYNNLMIFRHKDPWIIVQSLLFPGNFPTFNSPSIVASSDLTQKLFATFEQGAKLTLKKVGGLYHQQRVNQGLGVCPDWCTSRVYHHCEVLSASEKAAFSPEKLPNLHTAVRMFCLLIGFLFTYCKDCQSSTYPVRGSSPRKKLYCREQVLYSPCTPMMSVLLVVGK